MESAERVKWPEVPDLKEAASIDSTACTSRQAKPRLPRCFTGFDALCNLQPILDVDGVGCIGGVEILIKPATTLHGLNAPTLSCT